MLIFLWSQHLIEAFLEIEIKLLYINQLCPSCPSISSFCSVILTNGLTRRKLGKGRKSTEPYCSSCPSTSCRLPFRMLVRYSLLFSYSLSIYYNISQMKPFWETKNHWYPTCTQNPAGSRQFFNTIFVWSFDWKRCVILHVANELNSSPLSKGFLNPILLKEDVYSRRAV